MRARKDASRLSMDQELNLLRCCFQVPRVHQQKPRRESICQPAIRFEPRIQAPCAVDAVRMQDVPEQRLQRVAIETVVIEPEPD